ncbi:MAG: hypothetical protein ABI456_02825 [Ktedonobacteraceae bacterium]
MGQEMLLPRIQTYVFECVRLFHWSLFKPNTFRRELGACFDAPLPGNPHLTRTLQQMGVVSIVGSLLFILVMNLVYNGLFDWLDASVFLVAWSIIFQHTLSFGIHRLWRQFLLGGLIRIVGLTLLFGLVALYVSNGAEQVRYIVFSAATGMTLGLIVGLALYLILAFAGDLIPSSQGAYVLMCGWSISQAIGLTYGLVFGLTLDWQSLTNVLITSMIGGLSYSLGAMVSWGLLFLLARGWRTRGGWIRGLALLLITVMLAGLAKSLASGMMSGLNQSLPGSLAHIVALSIAVVNPPLNKAIGMAFGPDAVFLSSPGWILVLTVSLLWCLAVGWMSGPVESGCVGFLLGLAFGIGWGWTWGLAAVLGGLIGVLRLCFWPLECLWMVERISTFQQASSSTATHWLRSLPIYWDERIFLPLPLLGRFMIQYAQRDPETAQQTIEYLMTSTRQKRAATQAMLGIAIPQLAHCQTLDDIRAIADQLSWISNLRMQGTSVFTLTQFIEVSQQVRTVLPTRLDIPLTSLRTMQIVLSQRKATKYTTTFGSIIQQWLAILEKAQL